jgi:hypothetical protein
MTDTTVATHVHQALDTHGYFTTQVAFDHVPAHFGTQHFQLFLGKLTDFLIGGNLRSDAKLFGAGSTDAIDVRQANHSVLVGWNIYTSYTSHLSFPSVRDKARNCT